MTPCWAAIIVTAIIFAILPIAATMRSSQISRREEDYEINWPDEMRSLE